MEGIQYAFKVFAYVGGLLAIFELLPKEQRARIENRANDLLTWRLLWETLVIAVAAHVVFRLFPYVSPFALLIFFIVGSFVLALVGLVSFPKDGEAASSSPAWLNLATTFAFAIVLGLYFLNVDERILVTVSSVAMIACCATASAGHQIIAVAYFLFLGLPCLLSYWPGPLALPRVLAPYHWFTVDVVPEVMGSSYGILPSYSAGEFSSAYKASYSFMTDWLPWFIRQSDEVRRFLLASDGYLLIFGALAEVLFVYYLWKLIELTLLSIAVPLMRASDYLKTRIERDRVPIAGILIGLVSKTVDFAITTIHEFASQP